MNIIANTLNDIADNLDAGTCPTAPELAAVLRKLAGDAAGYRDQETELGKAWAALDVCDFTVHLLSLFLPDLGPTDICRTQTEAAHEAYREATGQDSFDKQIAERIARREKQP